MIKFLIFLSLLIQLSLLNIGYAKEYRNTEAGFKINIPQQEINIVSKNFYGGMQPNGNFIYVYSLNQKQASDLLEENFTTDAFNDDYTAIELLERSGIDPQKPVLNYWILFSTGLQINLLLNSCPMMLLLIFKLKKSMAEKV